MYVVDDDDTNNNDDEVEKTLAIIIGLIAAVALIIVFVSFLNKLCEGGKGIYICNPSSSSSLFSLLLFSLFDQFFGISFAGGK
jgi:hypothetical protein